MCLRSLKRSIILTYKLSTCQHKISTIFHFVKHRRAFQMLPYICANITKGPKSIQHLVLYTFKPSKMRTVPGNGEPSPTTENHPQQQRTVPGNREPSPTTENRPQQQRTVPSNEEPSPATENRPQQRRTVPGNREPSPTTENRPHNKY